MKKSRIYTKTGDRGKTVLIGGTMVPKHHYRLEAYGTIDELNAQIGLIRAFSNDESTNSNLERIQQELFDIGAYLATDDTVSDLRSKIKQGEAEINFLENEIDSIDQSLPPLTSFILPGGHPAVAQCHVARTVCRRAERRVVQMAEESDVAPWIIQYLNRLSDYFFVLSRYLAKCHDNEEIRWHPKLDD
ncbi:cob(I)yrinic acid a,c-diamide adenosyltransferase [Thermophagus xiamenensis]|uniref:Corrinoid adenosyltransferase n=1 Tax=Thermophagus xiamenensis TaxID=385682 RepID=A0A1I1Y130_9BACT|nr:cob(I)yrinic acid a,c-diamide adenosyltransferase [Thermophagus xiamenensis]SFE13256.1 cob(I)alamin adenosyltransferase [Thermophagus xiamenensis]